MLERVHIQTCCRYYFLLSKCWIWFTTSHI